MVQRLEYQKTMKTIGNNAVEANEALQRMVNAAEECGFWNKVSIIGTDVVRVGEDYSKNRLEEIIEDIVQKMK